MTDQKLKIRALNDQVRRSFLFGRVVMTSAVSALPDEQMQSLLLEVQTFEDFDTGNDPYGEHDFGAIEYGTERWFWKIDYFKRGSEYTLGSDDPSNSEETERVLTIMRSDEY